MAPPINMFGQSPHSSSGLGGSSEGTPDTRFTMFSPDDARPSKAANEQAGGTPLRNSQQDPFVSTATKIKVEQKLSATATAFKPFGLNVASTTVPSFGMSATAALPGKVQQLNDLLNQMNPSRGSKLGNATIHGVQQGPFSQEGIFSTDTGATRCLKITSIYKVENIHQIVTSSLAAVKKNNGLKFNGSERVELCTAAVYVRYSNINDCTGIYTALKLALPQYVVEYIFPAEFASSVNTPSKGRYSKHEGQVILTAKYPVGTPYNKTAFEQGLRDILSAQGKLLAWQKQAATEAGICTFVVEYYDAAKALSAVKTLDRCKITFPQGEVVLSVESHTPDLNHQTARLEDLATPTRRPGEQSTLGDAFSRISLDPILGFSGQPEAFAAPLPTSSGLAPMPPYAAPYGVAPTPLPFLMGGMYAAAPVPLPQAYSPGMHQSAYVGGNDFNHFAPGNFNNSLPSVHHGYEQDYNNQIGFHNQSYGHGYGNQNALIHGSHFSRPSGRRQNAVKVHNHRDRHHHHSSNGGHHNHVDIHRIKQGIDVRTTVMLRNIPNKVDQAMLKEIIDQSSFGKYDFMYLRIDFSNDCNVGYAFINFTDPLDIIEFVMARSNQKWHMFKSDKIAEVSYATIQGRDCLIQKFRNSSVMLEPPHYRPKLFFTIHDRNGHVGEEDIFPASDNASKLKRSCENAEHVGLFAPNAGQHLRDEQRRRRSQFDRGTSLAEREEYGYDDGFMHSSYQGYLQY